MCTISGQSSFYLAADESHPDTTGPTDATEFLACLNNTAIEVVVVTVEEYGLSIITTPIAAAAATAAAAAAPNAPVDGVRGGRGWTGFGSGTPFAHVQNGPTTKSAAVGKFRAAAANHGGGATKVAAPPRGSNFATATRAPPRPSTCKVFVSAMEYTAQRKSQFKILTGAECAGFNGVTVVLSADEHEQCKSAQYSSCLLPARGMCSFPHISKSVPLCVLYQLA